VCTPNGKKEMSIQPSGSTRGGAIKQTRFDTRPFFRKSLQVDDEARKASELPCFLTVAIGLRGLSRVDDVQQERHRVPTLERDRANPEGVEVCSPPLGREGLAANTHVDALAASRSRSCFADPSRDHQRRRVRFHLK
jgi:hypothetical protein